MRGALSPAGCLRAGDLRVMLIISSCFSSPASCMFSPTYDSHPSTACGSPGVAPESDATVTSISAIRERSSIALCSLSQRPARSCLTACTSPAAMEYSCFADYPTTANSTFYNCTSTTCTLTSVPEYPILGAVGEIGPHQLSPWDQGGERLSGWAAKSGDLGASPLRLRDERERHSSSAVVRNAGLLRIEELRNGS